MSKDASNRVCGEQTFRSGIEDMIIQALKNGGTSELKNCQITLKDGTTVQFSIEVKAQEKEISPNQKFH